MSSSKGEFAYIDWIRQRTLLNDQVVIGPGDDAAAVRFTPNRITLITTDMLMEGTCFRLNETTPRQVGRKAMAVNLSDIAAMAGRPVAAVVSVALPAQGGRALAEELYLGMRELADTYNTAIVGGDTNSWTGPLVIAVTLFGEATAKGPICRKGARPGDWLLVTGPLGGSILGKHLRFAPRIGEALQLHELADIHAMIDISDGLAADVWHLCTESRCGAILRAESIPITPEANLMKDGKSRLEHALRDGEDFELVLAVSPQDGNNLIQSQPISGMQLFHIGECGEQGLWLDQKGRRQKLETAGYVHPLT
jgi:thiamine-monophosphate kinase